ncbi:MAG: dihydroorotase family protein [Myxococcota bacterium]
MYDLILRDATIVTSAGREVADVAIQDGKIRYVGPRPPKRRTKHEISAIGRFLMPGVIDTGVQFEPNGDPTLWERESRAAVSGGVTTVLALPGGDQPVIDRASAKSRIDRVSANTWVDFGLWGAATTDNVDEIAAAVTDGLVQGTLAHVCDSGPLSVPASKVQAHLNSPGALGVQLEAILDRKTDIEALIDASRSRERYLHMVNLSTAEELQYLDPVRGETPLTASVTPHHLFLSEDEGAEGVQTTPPVRREPARRTLWTAVKRGRLDCLASDHHPHGADAPSGGVPGSELLFPLLLSAVKYGRLNLELLVALCAERPASIFGLDTKGYIEKGYDADLVLFSEGEIERVDSQELLSTAGWSPYHTREAAPKPDLVIVAGNVVAAKGKIIADAPSGAWLGSRG